ncbi:MAG: hypothetical protein RIT27_2300 [Pseudomonadota bacterium]|jgi:general secretion pathway protein J
MKQNNGFTLLEVLVVLVLLSLISALAFEILGQTASLRGQFLETLDELQQGVIREHWFRSSVSALISDYPPEEGVGVVFQTRKSQTFQGKETEFSGLTLSALDNDIGIPTAFGWQLVFENNETILRYKNSEEQWWEVMRWIGNEGFFSYQAKDGSWHKTFPLPETKAPNNLDEISAMIMALEKPAQLPRTILLQVKKNNEPFMWMVRISGKDKPNDDPLISIQRGDI